MGLITFIARKINPDKHQAHLRAPPYERKASAKSPVRLVQTVSSNSNVSSFSGSPAAPVGAKAREHPASPLSQASPAESAAPPPVILGFRGDGTPAQSRTLKGKRQADARRNSLLPGLPLPSPGPSLGRIQAPSPQRKDPSIRTTKSTTSVQTRLPAHKVQSSVSSSNLPASIRTGGVAKAYVDLLDAQSEIRPADFYTRVKASGARDYGEDVADRNIRANGSGHLDQTYDYTANQRRPFSSWSRPSNFSASEEDNVHHFPQLRAMKKESIDSALMPWPEAASHQGFSEDETDPAVLSAAALKKKRALQRQALDILSSAPLAGTYDIPSLVELDDIQDDQAFVERKNRRRSLRVSTDDVSRFAPVWDTTSPESDDGYPDTAARSPRRSSLIAAPGELRRGPSSSSKKRSVIVPGLTHRDNAPQLGVDYQPILSPQPTSLQISASLENSGFATPNSQSFATHNMYTVKQSQQMTLEPDGTMPDPFSLPHRLKGRARDSQQDWNDDVTDRESAPSPFIKTGRSRSETRHGVQGHSRGDTDTTPPPPSHAGEPEDHDAGRTSSTRHWSMTSTTPTMSSSSSATNGRPQSRHTASTSIDLSSAALPSASLVSSNSGYTGRTPLKKMPRAKPDQRHGGPAILRPPPFNIDDYVSSDDDSFLGDHWERAGNEEDLLFSSGYGAHGVQLPGLIDSLSAPAPTVLMHPRRAQRKTAQGTGLGLVYGEEPSLMDKLLLREARDDPLTLHTHPSRVQRSARVAEMRELAEPKELAELAHRKRSFDDGLERTQSPATRAETPRRKLSAPALAGSPAGGGHAPHHSNAAALGSKSLRYHPHPLHHFHHHHHHHGSNMGEQVIEEERLEKVDIATAIRLRKESKSRKRASIASLASQTGAGRGLV